MITAFCFLHELLRAVDTLVGWSWDKHVMPVPIYENIKYLFSLIETSDSIHTTPSAWENYTHGNFNQSSRLCLRIRSLVCQLYSLYLCSCIFLQHCQIQNDIPGGEGTDEWSKRKTQTISSTKEQYCYAIAALSSSVVVVPLCVLVVCRYYSIIRTLVVW